MTATTVENAVVSPQHYRDHPSGVECIQIVRHMGFNLGNAFKYIWRADLKHDDGGIEDLTKALTYIADEIALRRGMALKRPPVVLMALPGSKPGAFDDYIDREFVLRSGSGQPFTIDPTPLVEA